MPDPRHRSVPRLVPDLHLVVQVGDDETTAHLREGTDGLVLDVDRPATLLAAVGRRRRVDLPPDVLGLVRSVPIELRSRGRDLGRVTVGATGRLRARPTPAGLAVAGRLALDGASRRVLATWAGLAVLLVLAVGRRRRGASQVISVHD